MGGTYLDFDIDRDAAARYGLTIGDVQDVIQSAIGGMNVSWTVEGLERYPINIRYPRELRDDLTKLSETLVPTPSGAQVPISQIATLRIQQGPPMIKSENARPNAWIFVDLDTSDIGSWMAGAKAAVEAQVELPPGYTIFWSGQYEYMQRARSRLLTIVPITLLSIILILYLNTGSFVKTGIVLLAVPFSAIGAVWLLHLLEYNWSIAVWVGLIALAGLDAETGVVMLLYLDLAYERWKERGQLNSRSDLAAAVEYGAVQRIRPKMMTVMATLCSLVPILWATGTGADVMRRIAAPMVGGVVTSFVGELLVYPAIFFIWKARRPPPLIGMKSPPELSYSPGRVLTPSTLWSRTAPQRCVMNRSVVVSAFLLVFSSPLAYAEHEPEAWKNILTHYEQIRMALFQASTEGVSENAQAIFATATDLSENFDAALAGVPEDKAGECKKLLPEVTKAAEALSRNGEDLAKARDGFYDLSKPLIRYREMVSTDRPVVVYCSMVKKSWMQPHDKVENPYASETMPGCGTVISKN